MAGRAQALLHRTDLKFIVTGSSAFEMDKRSAESLAGRLELVFVKPFSLRISYDSKSRLNATILPEKARKYF